MRNILVSTLIALGLTAGAAAQGTAPDTVVLKNGDRLSGSVKSITADEVVIDTPATGEVKVKLAEVANVTTTGPIRIATGDGEKLEAPVQGLSDGKLRVGTGAAMRDVSTGALVEYHPPVEWFGTVNLGAALSAGNTERRSANAAAEVIRRTDDTRLTIRATWDYGEDKRDDGTGNVSWELTQRRTYGSAKLDYFVTKKLYAYAALSGENDFFADLELRTTVGAGLGYQIIEKKSFALQGEAGVSYLDENRYVGEDKAYVAARLAYSLRWDISDATQFLQNAEFFPSLEDVNDFYCRVDSRVKTSLTDSMFAQLQYILDYDNTPSPGFDRLDHRLIASVGWSF